ncbi:hypothetical protein [Methylobacterium nonmethylotrophicum]|uniref:Uncharacterized protein n=1 Tax=Methylobacterium nonmethylotrophicum TaxID=1141884 RepID=A0A4Z0NEQ7_9HYPH|nr:hypothetical protein [Methylobacterium nonmethylotrophicum]TGD94055.1 hypothetical protein EU555_32555 [Methylobacterium nonmethylotrophicum]
MPAPGLRTTARPITPGTRVSSGGGFVIACDTAGYVRVIMFDGTTLDVYAGVGTAEFSGYAIVGVDAAGTTATARVTVVD